MLFLNFHRDHHDDDHDDKGGLHRDLLETGAAMDRRRMLRTAARLSVALGAIPLIGCASDGSSITGTTDTTDTTGSTGGTGSSANCVSKIPEETAGPYPGDGSNGPNALRTTGVVRNDIRSSFGGLSGSVSGVLLNLELTIVSASTCTPLSRTTPCTCGTATLPATTRCIRVATRTRTGYVAFRRRTRMAR